MDLRTVLVPETVNLHLKGNTKEEIIDEMLDILIKAGKVTDKAAAREGQPGPSGPFQTALR